MHTPKHSLKWQKLVFPTTRYAQREERPNLKPSKSQNPNIIKVPQQTEEISQLEIN